MLIYTNNQGPKEWAEKIRLFLEKKINYKLFDQVIGAYKVNGKIVEHTRTTHDKTVEDLLRSTHLPNNTEICFIDDLYHPQMDTDRVYYINIEPYHISLPFTLMAERYYKQNIRNIPNKHAFINFINSHMKQYNLPIFSRSYETKQNNIAISKELLSHLQNFLKKKKSKTRRQRKKRKNTTRKK